MDAVKAKSPQPSQALQAAKRPEAVAKPKQEVKPEVVAAQKKPEQQPRPTTNTRGETLGRHLNVTA